MAKQKKKNENPGTDNDAVIGSNCLIGAGFGRIADPFEVAGFNAAFTGSTGTVLNKSVIAYEAAFTGVDADWRRIFDCGRARHFIFPGMVITGACIDICRTPFCTIFDGIAIAMGDGVSKGELFGLVLVLAGLAFKISAVPFHMWTPDVYEGAPTPVTAFFGSAPKVAAMGLMVRVAIEALGPAGLDWQQIIIFVALASILFGAVAAIGQTSIKRLMAYSSINNVGFALVGLAAGTPAGVAATMSYMAIYVVMTIGAFACILQMRDADGKPVDTIASLAGLSQSRKGLSAAFAIFMFSMAGIPPLFGFWAKFLVFDAAVAANLTALAAFGIAMSVIGAFYYLKIIKTIYFDEPAAPYEAKGGAVENIIMAACAIVIVFGYLLNPLLDKASAAAAASLF